MRGKVMSKPLTDQQLQDIERRQKDARFHTPAAIAPCIYADIPQLLAEVRRLRGIRDSREKLAKFLNDNCTVDELV